MESLARHPTSASRLGSRILVLFLLLVFSPALRGAAEQDIEYQVKAAFLLNFTRFVQWPRPDPASPVPPFSICISGQDPFGQVLDQVVEGETVQGRPIQIRRLHSDPPASCDILYVSKEVKDVSVLITAAGHGTLTVGEGESFIAQGGIISFVIENRRVRFDVSQTGARKAGLTLSSRLLSVARRVQ